jgi:hypothetical protein
MPSIQQSWGGTLALLKVLEGNICILIQVSRVIISGIRSSVLLASGRGQ